MNTINNNFGIFQTGIENKQSIIFIHGFPFDHKMWNRQIDYFGKDYRCISYDIRGLGQSPAGDGQMTIESFVDDLSDLIEELNLSHPVLCGLSMGGYISLRAIERDEDKFGGLILCDTKAEADNNEGKLNRAKGIKEINLNGVENFVVNFVLKCFSDNFIKDYRNNYEEVLNRAKSSEPTGVKGCLLAMAARTDTTNYLSKIKIPVLLLCGELDRLTPPDIMMTMGGKINNSEFVLIPEAGHVSAVENPKVFNTAVENFLKKI
ncbi:MAG: alpha/beta hydrolase [Ignavibacteriaceae bacterium]